MNRVRIPEEMDDPQVEAAAHQHALRSLNRTNRLLGADRCIARYLVRGGSLSGSVLDVGCGGGGLLNYLRHRHGRASRHAGTRLWGPQGHNARFPFILIGLDRSVQSLAYARGWQASDTRWINGDARRIPLADGGVDFVICSLFLHHFEESDAVNLLREFARVARRRILVADLVRSPWAWVLTWLSTRLLSRSWVFHVDGPRSVQAAFRPVEMTELARQAGLNGAKVLRCFPFRMMLTWDKPAECDTSRGEPNG